jgi:hypothetical protein
METICPHCGKKYNVADTAAGRQARCANPQCKQTFVVGAAMPAPASAPPPVYAVPPPVSVAPPPLPPAAPWPGAVPAGGPPGSPLDSLLSMELPGRASGSASGAPFAPLAPMPPALRHGRGSSKPLVFAIVGAVAVIAVIACVYFLVTYIGGGGGAASATTGWTAPYIMDGAKGIGYVNADKLRKSDAYRLFQKLLKSPVGQQAVAGAPLSLSDIEKGFEKIDEVFVVGTAAMDALVVVRTRDDMSLEQARDLLGDVARPKQAFGRPRKTPSTEKSGTKTAGNLPYVPLPGGFLAKTDSKTFCIAEKEDVLKPLSDRLAKKAGGKLDSQLQQILEHAAGDHYIAIANPAAIGASSKGRSRLGEMAEAEPQWVAFGLSTDSHVTFRGAMGMPTADDAGNIKKGYDEAMSQLNAQMKVMDQLGGQMPAEELRKARQELEKVQSLVRAVQLTQSGSTIRLSARWKVKDIEDLFEGLLQMIPNSPF